jgi:hypothetical protein
MLLTRQGVVLTVLFALSSLSFAQDKIKLVRKADEGTVARYESKIDMQVTAEGQTMKMSMRQVDKSSFKGTGSKGEVSYDDQTELLEQEFNGEKFEEPQEEEPSTYTVSPQNVLIGFEPGSKEDEDANKIGIRLWWATSVIFSDKDIAAGDAWTHQTKADAKLGTKPGKGDYKFIGMETKDEIECAKIEMSFAETSTGGITSKGVFWLDPASGDIVASEFEVKNVPFGTEEDQTFGSAKGTTKRIEGGPLKADASRKAVVKGIDDKVKDFEKIEGLFTIYRQQKDGRDTVYMEIKEDQLDKFYMLQASASSGNSANIVSGDPIKDYFFKIVKQPGDKIAFFVPDITHRATPGTPISKAVEKSFAPSLLETFKIEAKQDDRKSLLIDVGEVFRGDMMGLGRALAGGGDPMAAMMGGGGGFSMDKSNTYISSLKSFPTNVVVETTYNFNKAGRGSMSDGAPGYPADAKGMTLRVAYNLFALPENGYTPRIADRRVGYFTSSYLDHDNEINFDKNVNLILRWDLKKKDPSAAFSEPVNPIVFWIDNAVPKEYRSSVERGLLVWNKTFEKVGIKNAIVVKQMPDDAEFDHADMSHNVIRWVASPGASYAVAFARANPMTGQVLNASITVDANLVNFGNTETDSLLGPAQFAKMFEPEPLHTNGYSCKLDTQMLRSARFGFHALEAVAAGGFAFDRKAYIDTFLEHVVAHEMGHILGLRHNFAGSAAKSLEELGNGGASTISASVMDYVPFNVAAIKKPGVPYWTNLGPYDFWAIEYGYSDFDKKDAKGELPELAKIASRTNEPGLNYQTDEMAFAFDPYVGLFDLGAEPLAYYDRMANLSRYLLMTLEDRSPKQGESYWAFTRDWNTLFATYVSSATGAIRFIGGQRASASHKGDPGEKPVLSPLSASSQKKALKLAADSLFSERAFAFPKSHYTKMTNNPNVGYVEASLAGPEEASVFNLYSAIGNMALRQMFSVGLLNRVANNEFKSKDALRMIDLFTTVKSQVWSELGTGKAIAPLRRQLQRDHLNVLIDMVMNPSGAAPSDAKLLAWAQLHELRGHISGMTSGSDDPYTKIHLAECGVRIERALNATQSIGSASRAPSLMDLLMGGRKSGE